MKKNDLKIDTLYKVETPEGMSLSFYPAGVVVRALALAVDFLCQLGLIIGLGIVISILSLIFNQQDKFFMGLYVICIFLIYWWYFVFFEVLRHGQTIGKKAFNLRVIHDDGTPIGWSASLLRNLLRVVDVLPSITYSVGITSSISHRSFKRLGDIAAGTLVVYDKPATVLKSSDLPKVEAKQSFYPLTPEEQRLIVSFALRSGQLSKERRQELSQILGPVALVNEDIPTEHALYSIAHSVLGSDKEGLKLHS